jgi:hypothetical protein
MNILNDINMIARNKHRLKKIKQTSWPVMHDILLIENNDLEISALLLLLPYTEQEIQDRRQVLGLIRRIRQLNRITQ